MSNPYSNFQKGPTLFLGNRNSQNNTQSDADVLFGINKPQILSNYINFKNPSNMFPRTFNQDTNNYSLANNISSYFNNKSQNFLSNNSNLMKDVSSAESSFVGFSPNIPNMLVSSAMTGLNSSINSNRNSTLSNLEKSGNSQFGSSFYSPVAMNNLENHNNRFTDVENTLITVGSFFGPEGLAAGSIAAGGLALINSFSNPVVDTINTTSGYQENVNADGSIE